MRVSAHGLLTAGVVLVVGAAAFTSEANLLLLIAGIAIGVFAYSAVACVRTVRALDVERSFPEALVAGSPCRLVYVVRSRRKWFRGWAVHVGEVPGPRGTLAFPHAFIPMIEPGQELRVELTNICPWRGRVALRGIRITCSFPFGLLSCSADLDLPSEIILYPAVGRARRDLWRQPGRSEGDSGHRSDRTAGQDEFVGVREYRQGDNPRWIHWKRSAHTGQLVVREHLSVRDRQVIVLLDPWPAGAQRPRSAGRWRSGESDRPYGQAGLDVVVERIISAAATAVCDALDRGFRVGLVCRASMPIIVAPAGGRSQRQRLLRELALLAPGDGPAIDELIMGIRWSANWNARCIVFAGEVMDHHQRVRRLLTARSESVMLVVPQSGMLERFFEHLPALDPSGRVS